MTHFNSKATPTNDNDYKWCIKHLKLVLPIIWHGVRITLININSLKGGHTHTCIPTSQTKAISNNQKHASQRLVVVPGIIEITHLVMLVSQNVCYTHIVWLLLIPKIFFVHQYHIRSRTYVFCKSQDFVLRRNI